jgi:hypothetical protein
MWSDTQALENWIVPSIYDSKIGMAMFKGNLKC